MTKFATFLAVTLSLTACAHQPTAKLDAPAPIAIRVLKTPAPALISGRQILAYELILANATGRNVEVDSLEISADTFGHISYNQGELRSRFKLLSNVDADALPDLRQGLKSPDSQGVCVIPAGTNAAVFVWLEAAIDVKAPQRIAHVLHVKDNSTPVNYQATIASELPVTLGPPVRGGGWIPFQAPGDSSPHRRTIMRIAGNYYLAQRFAIDWGLLGPDGRLVRAADLAKNETFVAYDQPVIAVADGTIVEARDGLPDNSGESPTRALPVKVETVAGNHIILDLGNGKFALYAHLKPGSIKVKVGDKVTRGQEFARLGNSGNSSAPHLHFHVCDAPASLTCEGVPFALDHFSAQPFAMDGETTDQAKATMKGGVSQVVGQLIIDENVIGFP